MIEIIKSRLNVYDPGIHARIGQPGPFNGSLRADCRMDCRMMQDFLHKAGSCRTKCRISCKTSVGARVTASQCSPILNNPAMNRHKTQQKFSNTKQSGSDRGVAPRLNKSFPII
jgi:hypothetical protein